MPAKVIVFSITLVIFAAMVVYTVELFIPLSAKSNMNACCRKTLLKMEMEGGLSDTDKNEAKAKLEEMGFSNININPTSGTKQGEEISLQVTADYTYSKLTGLFKRSKIEQRMIYDRVSIARKVVN